MTDFTVTITAGGHTYTFNAADIRRDITDGAGGPIYHVCAHADDGEFAAVNLNPDWTVRSLYRYDPPTYQPVKEA